MPVSADAASTDHITAGIILAGGQSRRMGGGDKSLLRLNGQSLLTHVIAVLRPQCDALLISANGDPARFSAYGLPVIADTVEGFAGPLAGVLASLDFVAAYLPEARFAVSVAADTPFLPSDLVGHLHVARKKDGAEIACAQSGGRPHWIVALWPVAIRFALRHALVDEDLRKIEGFLKRYVLAQAEWASEPVDPFLNINEPADLVAAERILQEGLAPSHAL